MSGIIIPIIPKQIFNFGFLTSNASKAIVFHEALNTIAFKSAWLLVRVHNLTMSASQSLVVAVFGTDPSSSDPEEFTHDTPLMTVTVDNTVTAPKLLTDTEADLYPYLKIGAVVTQNNTSGTPLYVELSADLVLREV